MKKYIQILFNIIPVILFFLFPLMAHSQAEQEFRISGFAEIDHISYLKNKKGYINGRSQGILHLEIENRKSQAFNYFGSVEFRNDIMDHLRNRVWLDELYITWKSKYADVQLGKIIYSWGSTDGFSPTNNINPTDYSDLLDTEDEAIGVFSAKAKVYLGKHYLEAVVIPVFQPSVLPQQDSRWIIENPSELFFKERTLPVKYSYDIEETPPMDWSSYQFATRLGGTLGPLDYNLSYYHGFDDLPYFHKDLTQMGDSIHIGIKPKYHKISVYGVDMSTVLAGMVFKATLAYVDQKPPKDQQWFMGAPYLYGVIGMDKIFYEVKGNLNVLLNAQWIYQNIQSKYEVNSFNFNHIFQNAAFLRAEIGTYDWKFQLTGIYDFNINHYWLRPSVELKLNSDLMLNFRADILNGKEETLLGAYDNDRLQLLVKYGF